MASARSSTSAVTKGLPSRSPPIQLPTCTKLGELGRAQRPVGGGETVLQAGVEPWQFAQEGGLEVGQAVVDLIDHRQLGGAQHARLPQRQHRATQRLVVGLGLLGGELHAVARVQEPRDHGLAVEDALPLHLGGVGGEHRRHQRAVEEAGQRRGVGRTAVERALERVRQAALARCRAGDQVRARAPDVVLVLGDVGQVGEIAEGAHHLDGLLA
jgi:GNAT superfamily N-acetyltransferase